MPTLAILGTFTLAILVYVAGAAIAAGGPAQRWLGVLVGMSSMLVPWLIPPEHTTLRPFCVIIGFAGTMRVVDASRARWSLFERLVHVSSVVDTRRLKRVPPGLDRAALGEMLMWLIVGGPAYLVAARLGRPVDAVEWVRRWLVVLIGVYALTAAAYPLLALLYRALGFVTPPLHIAPLKARSVQEFWGERWNRTVSGWLGDTFFRPFARRRYPILGAFAAFFASAVLHAYVAWVAVGWAMGLWSLAFFLAQAVVIVLERRLGVRAWPRWAGHAWAVCWMVGMSPMFTEPAARAFGL